MWIPKRPPLLKGHPYAINSNDNAMTIKLIKAHHDYCLFILKQQAPIVEEALAELAIELEKN